jgi:hypothetical protein
MLQLLLRRCGIKGTKPTVSKPAAAGELAQGELWLNNNHESPGLFARADDDSLIEFTPEKLFLQDGTDAKPRTYLSKLKDVVSVKDFGAVGDGKADDTAALTAMFNHCNSQGKSWHIPAGDYLIQQDNVLTVKTGGVCEGKLIIPKANRSSRIEIVRDTPLATLSTTGWSPLNRDSWDAKALNALGMLVSIESTEILCPRYNPPSNTPYTKQEVVRCLDKDGFFSTPLVNTYNPTGNTITVRGAVLSTPITIKGLNVLVTGADSGTSTWREKIRVERDRVILEDLTFIDDNPAASSMNAVYVAFAADVVFVRPSIRGMPFDGAGYGIQFGNTIGCKVIDGNIQECRHAITGRHNCDLAIDGGSYSEIIDDHWGDRMVIKDLTITGTSEGNSSIVYAGNDIDISNVIAWGGRNFFGISEGTPHLGGTVRIDNVRVKSTLSGGNYYWFFGYDTPSVQGSSGTFPAGFKYKTPDLVSISNISLNVTASSQTLFQAKSPAAGGAEPPGAWESFKQIDVNGPFHLGNTLTFLVYIVKDGTKTTGNTHISIDCDNAVFPANSSVVYLSSIDASTAGRATAVVKNAKGSVNFRYSGYAAEKIIASNCEINDMQIDNPAHPVSGCISLYKDCEFTGSKFASQQTDCFFSGCIFTSTYIDFPTTRCAWIGNVRTAAQGALPTDIRANVQTPFQ